MKEDTDLMLITKDGKVIRLESGEIRQAGRSTQGVRLVRMEEGRSGSGRLLHSGQRAGERDGGGPNGAHKATCRCNKGAMKHRKDSAALVD